MKMQRFTLWALGFVMVSLMAGGMARLVFAQPISRPAGSDRAFEAFKGALPGATVTAVETPKDFGAEAADGGPLFLTFRYTQNGISGEVPITQDGLIIRLKRPIKKSELPRAVSAALGKAAKGARITSYEVQETRSTLKYVALPTPKVYYLIEADQHGKMYRMAASAGGKISGFHSMEKEVPEKDNDAKPPVDPKKIAIPHGAEEAVKATEAAYPGAVVIAVEEVGYESGTGNMAVLYYEVEFPWHGRVKEAHATPDGLMLDQDRRIEASELPDPVRQGVEARLPGASLTKVTALEDHAAPKFVALDNPVTTYIIGTEAKGKGSSLRFASDGSKILVFDPKTWTRK